MNRRTFLRAGAGAIAIGPRIAFPKASSSVKVSLGIDKRHVVATVPANFTGLSYESAQLSHPDFFSPSNKRLVPFMRTLGARGVLRIGGNTSEFTLWSPQGAPAAAPGTAGPDTGGKHRRTYRITSESIRNLTAFVEAVDWQLIYGLNLGKGTPEQAAHEAKAVSEAAGRRLLEFQIGNEPDLFHRNGLRPPDWKFSDYFAQWKQFASAVRRTVPQARFAAPDVAANVHWIVDFAKQGSGEIVELTGHYYAEGPPSNPAMNIDRLLHPNRSLERKIPIIQRTSRESGRPYRMAETNSCYRGGKPGVSDTFASALWGGDYMLQLEQAGFSGINFHGGGEGYYTPIAGSKAKGFSARPIYYGMLLAGQFAGTKIVKCTLDAQGVNATAYAARAASGLRVAIFNKDEQRGITVQIPSGSNARLWRLRAPSVHSKAGVMLAGAAVKSDGSWSPAHEEHAAPRHGTVSIDVPAASAVLAFFSA
jgi:hypothetical protein